MTLVGFDSTEGVKVTCDIGVNVNCIPKMIKLGCFAQVVKLADTQVLGTCARKGLGVRVSPWAQN